MTIITRKTHGIKVNADEVATCAMCSGLEPIDDQIVYSAISGGARKNAKNVAALNASTPAFAIMPRYS